MRFGADRTMACQTSLLTKIVTYGNMSVSLTGVSLTRIPVGNGIPVHLESPIE